MSSILEKKKQEEAEEHVRQAEKYLKTSPLKLKFSPEFEPAGDEYGRAGQAYKVAKKYNDALTCYLKAVDCYKEVHQLFQAGRMLENSVMVAKDMDRLSDISDYAKRGALMYRQVNKPEAAAQLLDKAAKIVADSRPEDAIDLYEKAAETVAVEDRPNVAAEYCGKAGRIAVRLKAWDRAITSLRNEIKYRQEGGSTPKMAVMGLLLIELKRGDRVAAEKVWRELGNWCDGDMARAVQNIIQGYDEQDGDMVSAGIDSPVIRNLDLDFARLSRELPRPASKSADGGDGEGQGGGEGEEDDNGLSGLC